MNAFTVTVLELALPLCAGVPFLAHAHWSPNKNMPQVKVPGLYSPVLTWIRYRQFPVIKPLTVTWPRLAVAPRVALLSRYALE
jgi:hypothetical protein